MTGSDGVWQSVIQIPWLRPCLPVVMGFRKPDLRGLHAAGGGVKQGFIGVEAIDPGVHRQETPWSGLRDVAHHVAPACILLFVAGCGRGHLLPRLAVVVRSEHPDPAVRPRFFSAGEGGTDKGPAGTPRQRPKRMELGLIARRLIAGGDITVNDVYRHGSWSQEYVYRQ